MEHKPASLHEHALKRVERLQALLGRLEAEGGPKDPVLDAVRSLLAEAEGAEPAAPPGPPGRPGR